MWLVLDQFSRTLIDAAVANAILLSVVVAVVVFTRQPARRIVLVQTGFYAAMAMIPLVGFDLLPRAYPVDWLFRTGLVPPPLTPEPTPMDFVGPPVPGSPGAPGHLHTRRGEIPGVEWPAGERLVRVATLIYLAAAAAGLAWFGLGLWGFRRLVDRSVAASPATRRVFEELIVDLGRSPPHPELRSSTWLRSPVLGGVLRPTIVIPSQLDGDEADPDALRLILLHELAHADRGDAWFNSLAALAQIVWFFLPHLWWLRSQLRIDQEFLADRKAAGPLGETTHYARWLVGLSSGRGTAARRADSGETAIPRSWSERGFDTPLLQRVAMLLYCPFLVEERAPRWFGVVVPAAFMAAALALSTFRVLVPVDPRALVHQAQARDPLFRSFQAPEPFDVSPPEPSDGRPGAPFIFPLALPSTFRLTARIEASPRAMGKLRIAGCPLVPKSGGSMDEYFDDYVATYDVLIRRGFQSLRVEVKRHEENPEAAPGELVEFDLDPEILNNARWLSITPADEVVHFKTLVMTW